MGDPCYVVKKHSDWMKLLKATDYFKNEEQTFKGQQIFADGTAYGDGTYLDQKGRQYFVDAGLIGIMPIEVIESDGDGGQIIEFKDAFYVSAKNGIFHFGDITINTKCDDDDKNEDEWEDEEDE